MALPQSLVEKIAQTLYRDFVETGKLQPGDSFPSIRELHSRYGTSRTTIAEALGQLQAKGVLVKRHGSGSYLSPTARQVPEIQSATLGVVTPAPSTNDLMARLFVGVETMAQRHNMSVLYGAHSSGYTNEYAQVKRMFDLGCSAVILSPVGRTLEQDALDYLDREFLDKVIIKVGQSLNTPKRIQITFDNVSAGYAMTKLLLDEGHEHIAFIRIVAKDPVRIRPALRDRYEGYQEALRDAGKVMRPKDYWEIPSNDRCDSFHAIGPALACLRTHWLANDDPATAVIAPMDLDAVMVINAARYLGIEIPESLRVVGFDNMTIGKGIWPPFPTTESCHTQAGELAVRLAIQQLKGEIEPPANYVLPVTLLPRNDVEVDAITAENVHDIRLAES